MIPPILAILIGGGAGALLAVGLVRPIVRQVRAIRAGTATSDRKRAIGVLVLTAGIAVVMLGISTIGVLILIEFMKMTDS